MSNHKLREDNICQNCHYTVDRAYCSNCGQKNTETRQSFFHLFTHFVEDFTHYDGAFWKTIAHLLFRPAKLTKEYLSGKRQTYVPPVKLYIFISFVTFFLMSVLPEKISPAKIKTDGMEYDFTDRPESDSIINTRTNVQLFRGVIYHSVQHLDSMQKYGPKEKHLNNVKYKMIKNMILLTQNYTGAELVEKINDGVIHVMPKVLFFYMPVFAFWLWLFHNKKNWYFFDHGIFTLHYFSLLLLLATIMSILESGFSYLVSDETTNTISKILGFVLFIYAFYYFFRSHSRMYGERKWVSRMKSISLFLVNFICIATLVIASIFYLMYSLY